MPMSGFEPLLQSNSYASNSGFTIETTDVATYAGLVMNARIAAVAIDSTSASGTIYDEFTITFTSRCATDSPSFSANLMVDSTILLTTSTPGADMKTLEAPIVTNTVADCPTVATFEYRFQDFE